MNKPNPGAWLSDTTVQAWNALFDSAAAAANPPVGLNPPVVAGSNPPVIAANPPVVVAYNPPVVAGSNPPVTYRSAANPPVGPGDWVRSGGARSLARLGSPPTWGPQFPWLGIDPSWVWDTDDALRAQALRKSQQRVAPRFDARLELPDSMAEGRRPQVELDVDPRQRAWRWDEPFRVRAAVAELLSRLVVEGRTLYWMPRAGDSTETAQPLFVIPPRRSDDCIADQIDKVARAAAEREDRLPEILVQAQDIGCFFDSLTGIDRNAAPRLRELLTVCLESASLLVLLLKHNVAEWRPGQRSARIAPVIDTPGHGALPSGHATQAALTSSLLSRLLYAGDAKGPRMPDTVRCGALDLLARRIAFNRVVAGVHFPMDSAFGYELGQALGAAMASLAAGGDPPARREPLDWNEPSDLELKERGPAPAPPPASAAVARAPDSLMATLWAAAAREVEQRRV